MYLIICDMFCNICFIYGVFFPCHLFVSASSNSLEAGSLHRLIAWAGTKASRRGVLAGGKAKGNEEKGTSSICHLAQLSIGSAFRRQFARVVLIIKCSRLKAWWRFPSRGISNVWLLDSGCFWSISGAKLLQQSWIILSPKDPRKKVAIKIENFRRDFPLDSPDFPGH